MKYNNQNEKNENGYKLNDKTVVRKKKIILYPLKIDKNAVKTKPFVENESASNNRWFPSHCKSEQN